MWALLRTGKEEVVIEVERNQEFSGRQNLKIMVSAVGEGRKFYEYGIVRFPVK